MFNFAYVINSKCNKSYLPGMIRITWKGCNNVLMDEHILSKMTSQRFSQAWIDKEVKQMSRKKKTI
jgi:hypothetical protein